MTEKIFRSIMIASIAAMLIVLVIITGVLFEYFGGIQKNTLRAEYTLAAEAVKESGAAYLSSLKSNDYRLTLVAADGTVLFDTSADAATMENHADREEIKEALSTGIGESERYSATLTQTTLYYAGRLADGTVLRISSSHASVLSLILGLVQPVVVVLVLMFFVAALLAKRMARRIVEPLNTLNLEKPLENKAYGELSPLLRRINALQNNVRDQLRELKRKTDEFEQIIGSMSEGLVLLDKKGSVVSINNAAMKLFSADPTCVGREFLLLDRSVKTQTAIGEALSEGHSELHIEKNGSEFQIEISRIESEGAAMGVVLLAFDVTDKVFAERNRREFTANVSHELKTPLQSIAGSAELIENGLVKPEDLPRFIGLIRAESARLMALIGDIVRLSQLDEGNEMQREDTDLYQTASEVIEELSYSADAKKITLDLTGEPVKVNGVGKLLAEVVFNLCDNAIKYTNQGGHVAVSVRECDHNAVLTVSDNGIGIPPENQARIFERFYRVDKSHSKASGGTGLGLSIVKHAVQYHHGRVTVESTPGRGSVFTVTLPIPPAESQSLS